MLKAILYKEWIKSRWYLAVAFAVTCAFAGYAMLRLYRALGIDVYKRQVQPSAGIGST